MTIYKYNSKNAIDASIKGNINEWIHGFLCTEGKNKEFSDELKLYDRYFIGPIKMPLKLFERCCGPEEGLKYEVDKNSFELTVNNMINSLEDGWDMPPLIINYKNNKFEINDGNHRLEALIRTKHEEYHVIIWITEQDDFVSFKNKFLKLT